MGPGKTLRCPVGRSARRLDAENTTVAVKHPDGAKSSRKVDWMAADRQSCYDMIGALIELVDGGGGQRGDPDVAERDLDTDRVRFDEFGKANACGSGGSNLGCSYI